jgi:hypothetical protein
MNRITSIAATLILLLFIQLPAAMAQVPAFPVDKPFEEVTKEASALGKPVILVIRSNDCASCRIFSNKVLGDTTIQGLYQRNFLFHMVYADSKEGRKLSYKYNVMIYPTIIYFSPDKEIIHHSNGSDQVAVMAAEARSVLQVTGTYNTLKMQAEKMNKDSYMSKKVQKKVAQQYAARDTKEGKTAVDEQVLEYTLDNVDLKHFKKTYVKTMQRHN